MFLYKYRKDSEFSESSIKTSKVWLATADALNDPFECSIDTIDSAALNKVVSTQRQAQLAGFIIQLRRDVESKNHFFNLSPKLARRLLKKMEKQTSLSRAHAVANDFLKGIGNSGFSDLTRDIKTIDRKLKRAGIFSLSEICDDAKMWAQYAGDHRGLCLGFFADNTNKLGKPDHCVKVSYEDSVPRFDPERMLTKLTTRMSPSGLNTTNELTFDDPNIKQAITTKSRAWESEREWRYIEATSGEYEFPAPLRRVVFGYRMDETRRAFYAQLIKMHIEGSIEFFHVVRRIGTNDFEAVAWQPA